MIIKSVSTNSTTVFGGGCFWCTEAVFKMLKGVISVVPGYAGGDSSTDHAEVIKIEYDPAKIKFDDLLTVFFASHDPTTVNRQGNDIGPQYRSIILYTNEGQKTVAEKFIKELNTSSTEGKAIVTAIVPFKEFFQAESYHLDYYAKNQDQPYCDLVINPKLEKVQQKFAELLK
jgi:peptide-methionine (S)-S-oxide reductase